MKYRKKPVVIEAVQYMGTEESKIETWHFCGGKRMHVDVEFYPCKPWIFEQTYERAEE